MVVTKTFLEIDFATKPSNDIVSSRTLTVQNCQEINAEINAETNAETDFVSIDKHSIDIQGSDKQNQENFDTLLLLKKELEFVFQIVEKNTEDDDIRSVKNEMMRLYLNNSTERTSITISHGNSLANFIAENAKKFADISPREPFETAMVQGFGNAGAFLLATADFHCFLNDYKALNSPKKNISLLEKSIPILDALCYCIRNWATDLRAFEFIGAKESEDIFTLAKFYKDLKNYSTKTKKTHREAKIKEACEQAQNRQAEKGMYFKFSDSVSAVFSMAATATSKLTTFDKPFF